MKVICALIEHFAAAVEIRDNPGLSSQAVVIGGLPHQRKPVFDCSAEAAQLGISSRSTLREAHHLCPDAVFLPLDEAKYIQAFDGVLEALDQFSPAVEVDILGKAFMDVSGLDRLFGAEKELAGRIASEVRRRTGFPPRIGLAGNKFVAAVAATRAPDEEPLIVIEGEEKHFLKPLPVELLPISEATKRMLKLLGLDNLGQIASLPPDALLSQFGQEGLLAHRLASGVDERLLTPRPRPIILEDKLSADNPLETTETLLGAIGLLLDKLMPKLRARNQVCGQLKLHLHLDGGGAWHDSFAMKSPTDSEMEILMLLKHRLEIAHFPGGVTNIHLVLSDLSGEQGTQGPLLQSERVRQEAQLKRAVKRLKVRFGRNPLKRVVSLDPHSRIPERRAGLIEFEP
jgi:nucleotidyltransferase/DNA polymerase involved in DNA repair